MPILTSADWPAVRAVLDTSLDATTLPSATIEMAPFEPAAEIEAKARDPLWATRTGDDLTRLKNATVYLTAARIAPSLPAITRAELGGDFSFSRATVDWATRATDLLALAGTEFDAYLAADSTVGADDMPIFFTVASGSRGR